MVPVLRSVTGATHGLNHPEQVKTTNLFPWTGAGEGLRRRRLVCVARPIISISKHFKRRFYVMEAMTHSLKTRPATDCSCVASNIMSHCFAWQSCTDDLWFYYEPFSDTVFIHNGLFAASGVITANYHMPKFTMISLNRARLWS